MPTASKFVGLVFVLALIVIGCGGDDDSASEPGPEVTSEPTVTGPTDSPDEEAEPTATPGGDEPTPTVASDDGIPDNGSAIPTPTQAPVSGEPAFTAASKLTTVGLDELFFGDPVDFAAEVAETTWVGLPEENARPQCYTVQPSGGPAGIYFTVVDGAVERVDITNPIITTRSGAGVGFGEQALLELFGASLEVTDLEGGKQVMFIPSDPEDQEHRIIWVTDGATVVSMRAGRATVVSPSSPCA
jgi:hypothetical protein